MPIPFVRSLAACSARALLWLWLACLPAVAGAQVAVPTLVPFSPNLNGASGVLSAGFLTLNPAAMQWGAPSRLGVGAADGEIKPQGTAATEYRSWFGGGRLVGQRFSAAGEGVSVRDRSGPQDLAIDATAAALGARLFSPLVIGFGYSTENDRIGLAESELTSWSGGASFRFGEWLFVGGAYGEDKLAYKDDANPILPYKFDTDRPFWMAGAGVRYGGRVRIHLEYYFVDRSAYNFRGTGFADSETQAGVAELGLGPFVLGFQAIALDEEQNGGRNKTEVQVYDLALAPLLGLAIGVRHERAKADDERSAVQTENRLTAVTLAYQF